MLIKKPVFIVGFAFGGSNILLNLLRSHPEICSPAGETDELFKGKNKGPYNLFPAEPLSNHIIKLLHYAPILLSQQQHVFSKGLWERRKDISERNKKRIDNILYYEKIKNLEKHYKRYNPEILSLNSLDQLKEKRGLFKNLSGLIYMSDLFSSMYPDAIFIGIVRNALAVCEGHARRGASLEKFAFKYEKACQQMIKDSEIIPNYRIFRFEDIIKEPCGELEHIYSFAGLDIKKVNKIKLEKKKVITEKGDHQLSKTGVFKELVEYNIEDFGNHFNKNVNENQIKRLSIEQKEIIKQYCKDSMDYFSY
jgi:hypothetical protein